MRNRHVGPGGRVERGADLRPRGRIGGLLEPAGPRSSEGSDYEAATKARARAKPLQNAKDLVPILLYYPAKEDARVRVIGLGVHEAFMVWIKAALLVGVVLASPAIFYFIWEFVAAGLYPHEKRYVHVFLPFSVALFIAGALLAFYAVMGFVLDFLFPFSASPDNAPAP